MKKTIVNTIAEVLETLELGQELDKKAFINLHWGNIDYFVERSFDVAFCVAKKQFPERDFKTKKRIIIRIK
jgi:hypothetical protein